MKISTLFYTIKQGFVNIFRNKWYSLASIATISACLFLFGLFYCIVANFQNILKTAEEGVSVTVFFHSDMDNCESHVDGQIPSEQRLEEIGQEIAKRAEVSEVQFQSADDAWATFGPDYFGEDYAEGFPENPLAGEDTYEIFLSDVSMQDALVTWLQSIPEVRKVNYSEMTANTLSGLNLLIAYVSMGIIVILLAVSIFLISNTVAIGISVRSAEINIMKYIGATDFSLCAGRYADRSDRCGSTAGTDLFPLQLCVELCDQPFYGTQRLPEFPVCGRDIPFPDPGISGCRCGYRFPGKYRYCKKASARVNTIPADNPDPICHDVCGVWLCTAS